MMFEIRVFRGPLASLRDLGSVHVRSYCLVKINLNQIAFFAYVASLQVKSNKLIYFMKIDLNEYKNSRMKRFIKFFIWDVLLL